MSNHKEEQPNVSGSNMHEKMRRAMIEKGWVIPTTPEEVAIAEAAGLGTSDAQPEAMSDPMAVLKKGRTNPDPIAGSISPAPSSATQDNFARAAREGKEISPEVMEKMKADREAAERDKEK